MGSASATATALKVAFIGPPMSGKSTAARLLAGRLDDADVVSASAPLVQVEQVMLAVAGLNTVDVDREVRRSIKRLIRSAFDELGLDIVREVFCRELAEAKAGVIINDDARAALLPVLRSFAFKIVWVERGGAVTAVGPEGSQHDHTIDKAEADFVIANTGSLSDLETEVTRVQRSLGL
ncbi:hypothetical protein [Streptomyces sp. NPDC048825]|uniref:hypothetical protein n=1 Tax=Streptomyces sp. NPDC048825 TaxID=3365592 RepID=UPI003721CA58